MLRPLQKLRDRRIFPRLIVTYMVFFAITLLVAAVYYATTVRVLQDYAQDTTHALLEQSMAAVNLRLQEIDAAVTRVAQDKDIQQFAAVKRPLRDADYQQLGTLLAKLPYEERDDGLVRTLFVYYPESEVILSPRFSSARAQSVYTHFINYEGEEYADWRQRLTTQGEYRFTWAPRSLTSAGEELQVLTMVQSIPNPYHAGIGGYVVVLVEEEAIVQSLDNTIIESGGASFVLDTGGNLMASVSHGMEVPALSVALLEGKGSFWHSQADGEYLVVHDQSPYNGWHYTAMVPKAALMERTHSITKLFMYILTISFLLTLLTAVVIAYFGSRPLQEIVRLLGAGDEGSGQKNEYDFISGNINKLLLQNENLRQDMSNQRMLIRTLFFNRLLHNRFTDAQDLEQHRRHAKVELRGPVFRAVLVEIRGYYGEETAELLDSLEDARVLVTGILTRRTGSLGNVVTVDEYRLNIVLGAPSHFDIGAFISRILEDLSAYNLVACIGVGRPVGDLLEMWVSCTEAERALELAHRREETVVYFSEEEGGRTEYYYPIQLENRLAGMVRAGDVENGRLLMDTLLRENFCARKLAPEKARLLIGELAGTVAKLSGELLTANSECSASVSAGLERLLRREPDEEACRMATGLLCQIAHWREEQRLCRNERLSGDIVGYIRTHYADKDLCLYSAAVHFGLAEKYFSRFFKEHVGENFSTYLEAVRMEEAARLLQQDSMTIAGIADAVGYQNINTFYKAFKRLHGTSPRNFKKGTVAAH